MYWTFKPSIIIMSDDTCLLLECHFLNMCTLNFLRINIDIKMIFSPVIPCEKKMLFLLTHVLQLLTSAVEQSVILIGNVRRFTYIPNVAVSLYQKIVLRRHG